MEYINLIGNFNTTKFKKFMKNIKEDIKLIATLNDEVIAELDISQDIIFDLLFDADFRSMTSDASTTLSLESNGMKVSFTRGDMNLIASKSDRFKKFEAACKLEPAPKKETRITKRTINSTRIITMVLGTVTDTPSELTDIITVTGTSADCIRVLNRELVLRCKKGNFDDVLISFNDSEFDTILGLIEKGIVVTK